MLPILVNTPGVRRKPKPHLGSPMRVRFACHVELAKSPSRQTYGVGTSAGQFEGSSYKSPICHTTVYPLSTSHPTITAMELSAHYGESR